MILHNETLQQSGGLLVIVLSVIVGGGGGCGCRGGVVVRDGHGTSSVFGQLGRPAWVHEHGGC